jgi:hypothetical protein
MVAGFIAYCPTTEGLGTTCKLHQGTNDHRGAMTSIRIQLLLVFLLVVPVTSFAKNGTTPNSNSKNVARGQTNEGSPKEYNFRKTSWGMSPAEVKASESAKFLEYDQKKKLMGFSGEVAGIPVDIAYLFSNNRLFAGLYMFKGKHINSNKYLEEFSKIEDMLVQKYGNPQNDQTTWSSDLFKDDPQYWGTAVSMGYLSHAIQWQTSSTTILLNLTGDNLKVRLGTLYFQNGQFDSVMEHFGTKNASDF